MNVYLACPLPQKGKSVTTRNNAQLCRATGPFPAMGPPYQKKLFKCQEANLSSFCHFATILKTIQQGGGGSSL